MINWGPSIPNRCYICGRFCGGDTCGRDECVVEDAYRSGEYWPEQEYCYPGPLKEDKIGAS